MRPITGFQLSPPHLFYVGCLETMVGCTRIRAMQSRNTGTCPVAIEISRSDGQIPLQINIAVNLRYSHYKSV